LLILGCSVIERQLPTQPSGSPGPTLPPIAIPVILPKPAPTPTPAATPAPTPTPAPPPNGGSCSLPPSNPENPTCTDGGARLYGSVDAALTRVTLSRPDLFDFNDRKCDNCYLVKDVDGYVAEVQKYLSAEGICTFWDGEELAAKETNDYSEQYDILLASGHMRRGVGSYRGVCRPSWF
jgi:hypothetical protein